MIGNFAVAIATVGTAVALTLSVYPGLFGTVMVVLILLAMLAVLLLTPVFAVVGLVLLIGFACMGEFRKQLCGLLASTFSRPVLMRFAVAFTVLMGGCGLLVFKIPKRAAFAQARPTFAQYVSQAPISQYDGAALNKRIGVYKIDKYATDPRGGTYFRTYTGWDGGRPDTMSYGFAYKPNRTGTPFGAAHYRLTSLGDDWYSFRVSNDWH